MSLNSVSLNLGLQKHSVLGKYDNWLLCSLLCRLCYTACVPGLRGLQLEDAWLGTCFQCDHSVPLTPPGCILRVHHPHVHPWCHSIPRCKDPIAGPAGNHRGSQGRQGTRKTGAVQGGVAKCLSVVMTLDNCRDDFYLALCASNGSLPWTVSPLLVDG